MELIKGKHLGAFALMPAKAGTCPECSAAHDPKQPHYQQSLFYKYKFYNEHGHWPTWKDAMAHCTEDIKSFWIKELAERGVKVE